MTQPSISSSHAIPSRFSATNLQIVRLTAGAYAVYDDATSAWWDVTGGDLHDLCDRLAAGQPDAYSLWCAGTNSAQIAEDDADALGLND